MPPFEENLVQAKHLEAASRWPELSVSLERFSIALRAAEGGGATSEPSRLDAIHVADLYLALACADQQPPALVTLDHQFIVPARRAVERVCRGERSRIDDAMQRTRERLMVGPTPKIATYTGRGPLRSWVRIVAIREALQDRRAAGPTGIEDEELLKAKSTDLGVELSVLRDRYGESFRAAVVRAVRLLTPDQRSLLRFHTHDGLSIDRLSTMLGVHRATVARRLERAREAVFEKTRQIVRDEHGLTDSEAQSLCGALGGIVDISIGRALLDESVTSKEAS